MKNNSSDYKHKKKNRSETCNRILITINVVGSPGPLRFVVNADDHVSGVIQTALKSYSREGRLPVLGSDVNSIFLYCTSSASDALCPWETIGSIGGRNFVLCTKHGTPKLPAQKMSMMKTNKRSSNSWKAWLNKSFSFKKISSI